MWSTNKPILLILKFLERLDSSLQNATIGFGVNTHRQAHRTWTQTLGVKEKFASTNRPESQSISTLQREDAEPVSRKLCGALINDKHCRHVT